MTPGIKNRGRRRRLAASFAAVALLGAGLVAGIRTVPPLIERGREVQRIAAQNEELRRQLDAMVGPAPGLPSEKDPIAREIRDRELRRRLIITRPAEKIIVIPLSTGRPQIGERQMTDPRDPPDGYKDVRIDHNGRMKMPADFSRVLQKHLGFPTPAKPTTKRRRQAADDSSSAKTAR